MTDANLTTLLASKNGASDEVERALLAEVSSGKPRFCYVFGCYKNQMLVAFRKGYTKNAIREAMINLGLIPKISRERFYAIWREEMPNDTTFSRSRKSGS